MRKLKLITNHKQGAHSMKVAFTTQDMKNVDAHFGWAKNIAIYEISPEGYRMLEAVQFDGDLKEDGSEDKLTPKIDAVRDCAILYVAAIGGSAAAKVVNARVHPVKVPEPVAISELLDKLQAVLQGTPPPWLRKALMKDQVRNLDFDDDEEVECHV
jgi:nitrogen fixation protein NifX